MPNDTLTDLSGKAVDNQIRTLPGLVLLLTDKHPSVLVNVLPAEHSLRR